MTVLPVFTVKKSHVRRCERLGRLCAAVDEGRGDKKTEWSAGGSDEVKEILESSLYLERPWTERRENLPRR